MRKSNENLVNEILEKTLELLQEKEPYEIGMREIANKCNVTATTIYLYFKDKDDLFRNISLHQLKNMEALMTENVQSIADEKQKIIIVLKTFRDWCFENPKTALLFMGKIDVNPEADSTELSKYYGCNRMGQFLLEVCVQKGLLKSPDTVMDTNIIIYGLWGCIESVIRGRADIELWEKGVEYTDRYIELILKALEK